MKYNLSKKLKAEYKFNKNPTTKQINTNCKLKILKAKHKN